MSVNIWVTEILEDLREHKASVSTGSGLILSTSEVDGSTIIFCGAGAQIYGVRETPAEIMALIAAEERKQHRREIAARVMAEQGEIARERGKYDHAPALTIAFKQAAIASVAAAEALLAALDAREDGE